MKKQNISRLDLAQTPNVDHSAFESKSDLPTAEMANKQVEQLTGQLQPSKEVAIGRVKLTTAMLPSVVTWFKVYAAQKGVTLADVLEAAALDYQDKIRRNA
jgi:hypothetical protein